MNAFSRKIKCSHCDKNMKFKKESKGFFFSRPKLKKDRKMKGFYILDMTICRTLSTFYESHPFVI